MWASSPLTGRHGARGGGAGLQRRDCGYPGHTTPDQIEFNELIVSELSTNGVMEAGPLYESPFLDISPPGPEGLVPVAKVDRMVQVLDEIRQRAAA